MFNKSLMFIAVGLFVSSAHAESKYVEFSIRAGDKTTSVTTEMGKPTLWESINKMSSACSFTSDNAGTPIDSEYSVDVNSGMSASVLPLERSKAGLKAYVSISKQASEDQNWAVINQDCKLPVGTTNSVGINLVDIFAWGKPTTLQLSDGSVVVVEAIDPQAR
ncbi:hypothetical protein JFT64_18535 [Pseudomonas carnis]|jgi:hypothetical protein|uniref:hypothetical protein n=1 Tax=Pseudomonas carnis TaxID=2487355 RepID=UPI0018E85DAA|nr:hypothetical protein [Pseudomonas carnis]MBJ2214042.1 hypothetical protein [Pseudomonas carnis]